MQQVRKQIKAEVMSEPHAQAIHVRHQEALLPAIIILDIHRVIHVRVHLLLQPITMVQEIRHIRVPLKDTRPDQPVHQIHLRIQISQLPQEQISQVPTILLHVPQVIVIQLPQEQDLLPDPVILPLVLQVRQVAHQVREVLRVVLQETHHRVTVIEDKILTLHYESYEK